MTAADLKPDNVLIDDELGDAVIADFGISSVVTTTLGNGSGRGTAVRSSGALRGTPNYMCVWPGCVSSTSALCCSSRGFICNRGCCGCCGKTLTLAAPPICLCRVCALPQGAGAVCAGCAPHQQG